VGVKDPFRRIPEDADPGELLAVVDMLSGATQVILVLVIIARAAGHHELLDRFGETIDCLAGDHARITAHIARLAGACVEES
jgi:hypothetical protein